MYEVYEHAVCPNTVQFKAVASKHWPTYATFIGDVFLDRTIIMTTIKLFLALWLWHLLSGYKDERRTVQSMSLQCACLGCSAFDTSWRFISSIDNKQNQLREVWIKIWGKTIAANKSKTLPFTNPIKQPLSKRIDPYKSVTPNLSEQVHKSNSNTLTTVPIRGKQGPSRGHRGHRGPKCRVKVELPPSVQFF